MNSTPQVAFTLVHGTFAQKSTWPKLEAKLKEAFGESVPIHYQRWSGWNTLSARQRGGERLAKHLREWPGDERVRHFVIAHSHGGAVAIVALRDPDVEKGIAGLICLSTPFLFLRRRVVSELRSWLVQYGIFLAVVIAAMLLSDLAGVIASAMSIVFGVGLALMLLWSGRHVDAFIQRTSLRGTSVPTLIVRSPADEASTTLILVQALAWVMSSLWTFLSLGWLQLARDRASAFLGRHRPIAIGLILILLPGLFLPAVLPPLSEGMRYLGLVYFPVFIVGIGVALGALWSLVLAAVAVVPVLLLLVGFALPFGPEFALHAPNLEITVEATPPGRFPVIQLPFESGRVGLQHSTHESEQAIAAVISWIMQCCAADFSLRP